MPILNDDKTNSQTALRLLVIASILIPILIGVWFIGAYAANGLWQDEWSFLPYLQQYQAGHLDLGKLFQYQHNEHKLFLPSLLLLVVANATHYNGVLIQYVGWLIIVLTTATLLAMTWQRAKQHQYGLLMLIPVSLVGLSLRQWENMICCFPYSILSVSLFFALTTLLLDNLDKGKWQLKYAGAIITALCCTYSYANGLFVWPIGFLQLGAYTYFANKEDKRGYLGRILGWGLISLIVCSYYLFSYKLRKGLASYVLLNNLTKNASSYIEEFIASLATPLTGHPDLAFGIGMMLLAFGIVIAILLITRTVSLSKKSVAPLALIAFGLICNCLIFYGRADAGIENMLCSRYASLTNLWVVGFYLLVLTFLNNQFAKEKSNGSFIPWLVIALSCLMIEGAFVSFREARIAGETILYRRLVDANKLLNCKVESDENLMEILPYPAIIRFLVPYLQENKLSVFSDHPKITEINLRSPKIKLPQIYFDCTDIIKSQTDDYRYSPPKTVQFKQTQLTGWIIDPEYKKPFRRIFIEVDGNKEFEAACGLPSPNLVHLFHQVKYDRSGFAFFCRPNLFSKGKHTIAIKAIDSHGEEYFSPTIARLTVR